MAEGNETTGPVIRPRVGEVRCRDGVVTPVRFVQTEDPLVFVAVTVDGERIVMQAGDQLLVDMLGPGQMVSTDLERFGGAEDA